MKISSLVNLVVDASDLLDFFEKIDTPDQLISRLELLKRKGTTDLLSCIEGLRGSVSAAVADTIETTGSIDEGDQSGEDDDLAGLEAELAEIEDEENPAENQDDDDLDESESKNPTPTVNVEKPKNDMQP